MSKNFTGTYLLYHCHGCNYGLWHDRLQCGAEHRRCHQCQLCYGSARDADHGSIACVLEFFVVEKLATGLAFMFMRPTDRPQFITYAISLMIVCIMCPVMSLIATVLFKEPGFGTWVHTWGYNMPMALCWQMLYCGPLARAIFRLVFRRGAKQAD